MIPTITLNVEIPVHYFSELEPIFRMAERQHVGTFRGLVASAMADTLLILKAEYDKYNTEQAAAQDAKVARSVDEFSTPIPGQEQRPGHPTRFGDYDPEQPPCVGGVQRAADMHQ